MLPMCVVGNVAFKEGSECSLDSFYPGTPLCYQVTTTLINYPEGLGVDSDVVCEDQKVRRSLESRSVIHKGVPARKQHTPE